MRTQFITDADGKKLAVILPIEAYHKILEDLEELEDLRLYDAAKESDPEYLDAEQAFLEIEKMRGDLEKSLLQEMLYSAASLGSFIRSHDITRASEHFRNLVSTVQANLTNTAHLLEGHPPEAAPDEEKVSEAQAYFQDMLKDLLEKRQQQEQQQAPSEENLALSRRIQEAQLVMDQLVWLLEISERLKSLVPKVWP